jgi:hypothetical protein
MVKSEFWLYSVTLCFNVLISAALNVDADV